MVQLFLELVVVDFGADLLHVDVRHLPLVEFLVANFGRNVLHQVMSRRCGLVGAWLRLVLNGKQRLGLRLVHGPHILGGVEARLIILSFRRVQTPVEHSRLRPAVNFVQRGAARLLVPALSSGLHLLIRHVNVAAKVVLVAIIIPQSLMHFIYDKNYVKTIMVIILLY